MYSTRALALSVSVAFFGTTGTSLGEEFQKYTAAKTLHVIAESAPTMSAPDAQAYSTGNLKRGDVVDVYGKLGDEWIAIRPPTEQFDWLAAQDAHLLPGGKVAEVIDQASPAWMHTDSKERGQFQWQIKLQPTQQVNIRGHFNQELKDGRSRAWYKIDPPPGEFRWVRANELSETPPRHSLVKKTTNTNKASNDAGESEVQQASSIVSVSTEPVVLSPGEVVVSEDPMFLETDSGFVGDESSVLVHDASGIPVGAAGPCATCGVSGGCGCADAELGTPMHRVRPINKLLSLVGISIVEAERVPGKMACGGCGLSTCAACQHSPAITYAGSIGSLPSRMDRLPRPTPSQVPTYAEESLLIDRLGVARQTVRESIADTRQRLHNGTESLLTNKPANVSLGTPMRNALNNREPIFGGGNDKNDNSSWQGLPHGGVANSDLELDVQNPTSADSAPSDVAPTQERGSTLRTSTPISHEQGALMRPRDNDQTMDPSNDELKRVAGELTSIVSQPTEQWRLNGVRQQVEDIIETGGSPVVRGEARLLLERIDNFEDFHARWMRIHVGQVASNGPQNNQQILAESKKLSVQTASYQNIKSGGDAPKAVVIQDMGAAREIIKSADASGWLVEVYSDRDDYPKFALTDDAGRLVTYVESTAVLNLRGYLKQPVALYGRRGMNSLLNARTLFADRVVRISDGK